ncbi:MAG: hypothetical protein IKD06_04105 [Clostridia bacterium]|nr:hypothetical protein [Clostridia bacterium]
MTLSEKVAYLKGLLSAYAGELDPKTEKVFNAIADVLEDTALTVSDLEDKTAELEDYLEEVDEDLADVEDFLDDEDEDEDDDWDEDCCCVSCPECGEEFVMLPEMFEDDKIICPACNKPLDPEELECGCCGCDCDGDCEDECECGCH